MDLKIKSLQQKKIMSPSTPTQHYLVLTKAKLHLLRHLQFLSDLKALYLGNTFERNNSLTTIEGD